MWLTIVKAIEELLSEERPDDAEVHQVKDSLTGVASGDVRFTPESGHSGGSRKTSANDPKRTFDVHELRPGWAFPSQPILT